MSHVLIWSDPGDGHAIAVALALQAQGHDVARLSSATVPVSGAVSFRIGRDVDRGVFQDRGAATELNPDVVWLRRPAPPTLDEYLHPSDRLIAARETSDFVDMLWTSHAASARWVNPYQARLSANCKSLQLSLAREAGLKIPRTLISNCRDDIVAFIASMDGETVYKGFNQPLWRDAVTGERQRTYTSVVGVADLPTERAMRRGPGIFQEHLQKSFEVRATFFDDHDISVKIDSQANQASAVDWRLSRTKDLAVEPVSLPSDIRDGCRAVMSALGIRFGCFDFIVRDDDWIFLEVNQAGQFLWVELRCPEIPMLSTFAQFLTATEDAPFRRRPDEIRLRDVIESRTFLDTRRTEQAARVEEAA